MKKVLKYSLFGVIIIYLLLFFCYKNGYYKDINREKKILTEEMIQEYENDLKNGIDVSKKDYVVISPNYDNSLTRGFLKISKTIEKTFDKAIKFIFRKLNKMVDE